MTQYSVFPTNMLEGRRWEGAPCTAAFHPPPSPPPAAGGRTAGCGAAGVCQQAGHAQRHACERADRQAGATALAKPHGEGPLKTRALFTLRIKLWCNVIIFGSGLAFKKVLSQERSASCISSDIGYSN